MCAGWSEAHDEPMFNSYEMTRAFVAERQGTLRHEARHHRLGRGRRQTRRDTGGGRVVRLARPAEPAAPVTGSREDRAAA
jgi:hypothetical protein